VVLIRTTGEKSLELCLLCVSDCRLWEETISKISQDGVSDTVTMVRQSFKSAKNNRLLFMVTFCPSVLHRYSLIFLKFAILIFPFCFYLLCVSFKAMFLFSFMCPCTLVKTFCTYIYFTLIPALFSLIFTSSTDRLVQSCYPHCFLVISSYIFDIISLPTVFLCNFSYRGLFLLFFFILGPL
jgi:hypothetical protein